MKAWTFGNHVTRLLRSMGPTAGLVRDGHERNRLLHFLLREESCEDAARETANNSGGGRRYLVRVRSWISVE